MERGEMQKKRLDIEENGMADIAHAMM